MTAVPIYRFDEHHQAFLAWWCFFGGRPADKYHLVHIDEHADFGIPYLTSQIPQKKDGITALIDFTYNQLSIGTFLIPAHYCGFFDQLSWIKPSAPKYCEPLSYSVWSDTRIPNIEADVSDDSTATLLYNEVDWSFELTLGQPWLLDICLDAFACQEYPQPTHLKLEITHSQFEELMAPRLDAWHARYGASIRLDEQEGRYYISLMEPPISSYSSEAAIWQEAQCRLTKFREWLETAPQQPSLCTLSRSVMSGYTPSFLADRLEGAITEILSGAFGKLGERNLPYGTT